MELRDQLLTTAALLSEKKKRRNPFVRRIIRWRRKLFKYSQFEGF
jgi:hypothetical protein